MSLRNKIIVNTYYTRSVNLERDAGSIEVVSAYIPTSRAVRTLERIAETFLRKAGPRAWSLIGPYGSGKSSFAVFLSQLLAGDTEGGKTARKVLREDNRSLAAKFANETRGSEGYLKVLITGSPEPLTKRLVAGLYEAALVYWGARRGPNNAIVDELKKAKRKQTLSLTEAIDLIERLQEELAKSTGNSCRGILLVIDELGKFLEYEARHYGANDIYLLQILAEHALKEHPVNFLVFVLLHQSFEQYAKGLSENLKAEWSKVQGRFEDVPFLESMEQVLRVVSAALEHNFTKEEDRKLTSRVRSIVKAFQAEKAMPGALKEAEAISLFRSCYPFHPVSALLLPWLCQKVAQNERTLFSYLSSHEEFGLQHLLDELKKVGDWIYPHHIYDYFIRNQPATLGDSLMHRRWSEVITAVERLGDGTSGDEALLKTIGVLNIIGSRAGFKASNLLLELCAPTRKEAKDAIRSLKKQSAITYRRFNGEHRVWQGSDFDLEEALEEEIGKLGNFNLAEELNNKQCVLPVIARKYTIQNGALRYFTPRFIDAISATGSSGNRGEPELLICLANDRDDIDLLRKVAVSHHSPLNLFTLCLNGGHLYQATVEVKGLENVEANCQELNSDPVAKREFRDRLIAARMQQKLLLQGLIENPSNNDWYWEGKRQVIQTRRGLQETLSKILEKAYSKAPEFHNELINRNVPSSQAAAGRNRLLFAMLSHQDKTDLGIKKFPPEKAMYRALLKANGLHRGDRLNKWRLASPPKSSSVYPVWQRIVEFLETTEKESKSFAELSADLKQPPYGVKEGVLPVLYTAVLLVHEHELAVYENRRYVPYLDEELLERFVKKPDEFAVQLFRIEGLRVSICEQYSKALLGGKKLNRQRTVLDFAKPLAKFINNLEEYTKKTKSSDLSATAKAIRDAFNLAKSPEQLLFIDLPTALGYNPESLESGDDSELQGFAVKLMDGLRELKMCFENMLIKQKGLLIQAFHENRQLSLEEIHNRFSGRYKGLEQHTVDVDGLKAFINRLTKTDCEPDEWLKNLLAFLGQKPVEKWTDADRANAEAKLSDYSMKILDLETIRLHYDKNAAKYKGDFDVILLKAWKKGAASVDEVVAIDGARHEAIQEVKKQMTDLLSAYNDSEMKLATVAEFVDDYLTAYREGMKTRKNKPVRRGKAVNE